MNFNVVNVTVSDVINLTNGCTEIDMALHIISIEYSSR